MASITSLANPSPCASSTFKLMMCAPGATPRPPSAVPAAATIPATCVPCPLSSPARPRTPPPDPPQSLALRPTAWPPFFDVAVKSTLTTMRPRNSGTSATPVSTTATPMPAPVTPSIPSAQPSSHTWSAPIATVVTAMCPRRR